MFQGGFVIITPLNIEIAILDTVDEATGQNEVIFIIIDNKDTDWVWGVVHVRIASREVG
jgi:hypothetical protein